MQDSDMEPMKLTLKDFVAALQSVHEVYPHATPNSDRPGRLDFYFIGDLPCASLLLATGQLTIASQENVYTTTIPQGAE